MDNGMSVQRMQLLVQLLQESRRLMEVEVKMKEETRRIKELEFALQNGQSKPQEAVTTPALALQHEQAPIHHANGDASNLIASLLTPFTTSTTGDGEVADINWETLDLEALLGGLGSGPGNGLPKEDGAPAAMLSLQKVAVPSPAPDQSVDMSWINQLLGTHSGQDDVVSAPTIMTDTSPSTHAFTADPDPPVTRFASHTTLASSTDPFPYKHLIPAMEPVTIPESLFDLPHAPNGRPGADLHPHFPHHPDPFHNLDRLSTTSETPSLSSAVSSDRPPSIHTATSGRSYLAPPGRSSRAGVRGPRAKAAKRSTSTFPFKHLYFPQTDPAPSIPPSLFDLPKHPSPSPLDMSMLGAPQGSVVAPPPCGSPLEALGPRDPRSFDLFPPAPSAASSSSPPSAAPIYAPETPYERPYPAIGRSLSSRAGRHRALKPSAARTRPIGSSVSVTAAPTPAPPANLSTSAGTSPAAAAFPFNHLQLLIASESSPSIPPSLFDLPGGEKEPEPPLPTLPPPEVPAPTPPPAHAAPLPAPSPAAPPEEDALSKLSTRRPAAKPVVPKPEAPRPSTTAPKPRLYLPMPDPTRGLRGAPAAPPVAPATPPGTVAATPAIALLEDGLPTVNVSKKALRRRCACRTCGTALGLLMFHGTKEELRAALADGGTWTEIRVVCVGCFGANGGGEEDGVTPMQGVETAATRKKRRPRRTTPESHLRCEACSLTMGFGGVRMVEEGEEAEWVSPPFKVEALCEQCVTSFDFCTQCGGGGLFRTGKWRPRELFPRRRRTCSLPHLRLGDLSSFQVTTFRCPTPLADDPDATFDPDESVELPNDAVSAKLATSGGPAAGGGGGAPSSIVITAPSPGGAAAFRCKRDKVHALARMQNLNLLATAQAMATCAPRIDGWTALQETVDAADRELARLFEGRGVPAAPSLPPASVEVRRYLCTVEALRGTKAPAAAAATTTTAASTPSTPAAGARRNSTSSVAATMVDAMEVCDDEAPGGGAAAGGGEEVVVAGFAFAQWHIRRRHVRWLHSSFLQRAGGGHAVGAGRGLRGSSSSSSSSTSGDRRHSRSTTPSQHALATSHATAATAAVVRRVEREVWQGGGAVEPPLHVWTTVEKTATALGCASEGVAGKRWRQMGMMTLEEYCDAIVGAGKVVAEEVQRVLMEGGEEDGTGAGTGAREDVEVLIMTWEDFRNLGIEAGFW
ncbi:hypothetical protein HDU96_005185 [Phlyctochytrium bullatum]|nr:hypothetical protein HDU96_005185 [Phlyctochytrium bullatum]